MAQDFPKTKHNPATGNYYLYQKLVENINEGLWMCDKNDYTIYANAKFCEISGYSLEELQKMKEYAIWSPQSRKKIQNINKNTRREKKQNSTYEAFLLSKNGEDIPVRCNGAPLADGGTLGVFTDLRSERKRESVYQKLVDKMHEGVWTCDQSDHVIYANPKFCEMSGYSLEELTSMTEYDLWDKKTGTEIRRINSVERKQGVSSSYEATLITKTGEPLHLLVTGTPLDNGNTMGIFSDMTEMKRQQLLYKNLVINMSEAVWMGDKNGKTVYANPKFCELFEASLEDILGRKSEEFLKREGQQGVKEINKHKIKKQNSSYEAILITQNNAAIPVLVSESALPNGEIIAIITDLRELKEKMQTERILSNALAHTYEVMILFDDKSRILMWNKGAKQTFGYSKKEMAEHGLSKIFPPADIESIFEHSKNHNNLELVAQHKNGSKVIISGKVTPTTIAGEKKALSYLLLARDITNQLKFEEELALKYQKMKEAYNQFGIIRRQMDYIFDLLEFAKEKSDLDALSNFIVSSAAMLSKADACMLRLYNAKKGTMDLKSIFGATKNWWGNAVVRYKGSLVERAFLAKQSLKVIDLANEPRYHSAQLARSHGFSSLLVIPLGYKGQFLGAISLYVTADKKLEILENEFLENYAKVVEVVLGGV